MGITIGGIADYVGTFFATDAAAAGGAAAGAGAASGAAAGTAAGVAADTVVVTGTAAGAGAGTAAAVGGAAAAGGAAVAVDGQMMGKPLPSRSIATTISEASAVASGTSSLATLAAGPGRINVPPTPGVAQQDQDVQNVEQQTLRREQVAGGLQGTTGTPGGQAGAVLNPGTLSNRSVLGG